MAKTPSKGGGNNAPAQRQLAPNEPASPETSVSGDPTTSIMMGDPTTRGKPKARRKDASASVAEIDQDGVHTRTGLGDPNGHSEDQDQLGQDDTESEGIPGEGGEGEDRGEEGETEGEALPDYDPDDAEAVDAYEAAFLQDDGSPNLDRLTAEWFKNANGDPSKGGLNEGTYSFLQERYGLTREQIKEFEAGQVARQTQAQTQLYERAGGKERLDAAVKWGAQGGYTPAQRQRFNAAMNSGDPEVVADAVDALVARYERANPRARQPVRPQGRRPVSPQRDATRTAAPQRVQGYASYAEYQAEARAARAAGDMQKLELTRKRLRASDWFGK
jgi:hypothetical protein